ncbi:MAG TPA: RNA methyltransferase [Anaerolineae bacterium]|nr:RNA methyltransferase [Anaerolineae bacterium]
MITSTTNNKVKYVRRLQNDRRFRHREKQFVIEGTRWFQELPHAPHPPTHIFYTEDWLTQADNHILLEPYQNQALPVAPNVMAAMSDTQTPAGILATLPLPHHPLPTHPRHLLLLDQLKDPGNLGTIIRTAAAAGVDALLLTPHSVDPFNPKVVRASMGALLRLPIHTLSLGQLTTYLAPTTCYLADINGTQPYTSPDWTQPTTLIIGSEAHGASLQIHKLVDHTLAIPMANALESLNAATATAIILFEAVRQYHNYQ